MLNAQKRKFAELVVQGFSFSESAREAGYSEKTAASQGCRLSKDIDVKSHIDRLREIEKIQRTGKSSSGIKIKTATYKYKDPLDYLLDEMNDETKDDFSRKDAAKTLMPYFHAKKGDMSKRDAEKEKAEYVAKSDRLQPTATPIVNYGSRAVN